MQILAHRGWWFKASEKNTRDAFERAFSVGYGVETDVRDCDGELVISHDMPRRASADPLMTLDEFLDIYTHSPGRPTLALNVKADGLQGAMKAALSARGVTSYFVFDMSVPDTLGWLQQGMTVFTRRSEFEQGSTLDSRSHGFWLDAFETPYVRASDVVAAIKTGKPTAIVSPELHQRPYKEAWAEWRAALPSAHQRLDVLLCTDRPEEAARYFCQLG